MPAAASTDTPPVPLWAMAALALAMLLSALGTSIANVALPTLADTFGAPFQDVQWVVLAYLLASTTLIVGVGRLADMIGQRRLLLAGIAVFTIASVMCGAAPALPPLIAARAAQGLGAGVMMALATAFVGSVVPKTRTGRAMGLLGTMSAVGTALGPTLGGVLIASFGWRAVFLINLPLGLLGFAIAWRGLPKDVPDDDARVGFDVPGMLLLVLTLSAYALAMTTAGFGPVNAALLLAAGMGIWLFVVVEKRVKAPLISPAIFRDRRLAAGLAMGLLIAAVLMTTLVVGPFYLARALALSPVLVGLAMSAGPLAAALTGIPAGRAVDRFGAQAMAAAGLTGVAAGCGLLVLAPAALGVLGYVGPLVIITSAYALFQAANNTAVMTDVPPDRRGVVSGLLNLARNLGLITGASVMGAVFAHGVGPAGITAAAPGAVVQGLHMTFAAAGVLALTALAISLGARSRAQIPA